MPSNIGRDSAQQRIVAPLLMQGMDFISKIPCFGDGNIVYVTCPQENMYHVRVATAAFGAGLERNNVEGVDSVLTSE